MKEKYGSDAEEDIEGSEDSEEDTTEDEEGEELTPAMDAAILRTLARIKRKDPTIYDNSKSVFEGVLTCSSYWKESFGELKAEEQQKVVSNAPVPITKKSKEKVR